MTDVIGWPLPMALAALAREGVSPQTVEVAPPRPRPGAVRGTPRVIRVDQGGAVVLCARFPDTLDSEAGYEV